MSKIFCLGFNKTGTTSLSRALEILGYSICPEYITYNKNSKYFYEQSIGEYDSLFKLVNKYDAFQDRPWNHTDAYKIMNEKFPDSKFILTIRDTDKWINSYLKWSDKIGLKKMWYYELVSKTCYGINDFISDKKIMSEVYERRNNEIVKYFENEKKILILNLDDNVKWEYLCNFLDKKIPNVKFPHLNVA